MSNFVAIRGIDWNTRNGILDTMKYIKRKFVKGAPEISFGTFYENFVTMVQTNDLFEIVGMTNEQLEHQKLFVEKFREAFTEKFLSMYKRKKVAKVWDRFRRFSYVSCDSQLYLGTHENVNDITSIFVMFKEYADFIINLYDIPCQRLEQHLTKEGVVLQNFIETTKITGKVSYYPMINDIRFDTIPFVYDLNKCKMAVAAIDAWFALKPFGTNIPADDLVDGNTELLVVIAETGQTQPLSLQEELFKLQGLKLTPPENHGPSLLEQALEDPEHVEYPDVDEPLPDERPDLGR
jgi:hypothetical protein